MRNNGFEVRPDFYQSNSAGEYGYQLHIDKKIKGMSPETFYFHVPVCIDELIDSKSFDLEELKHDASYFDRAIDKLYEKLKVEINPDIHRSTHRPIRH